MAGSNELFSNCLKVSKSFASNFCQKSDSTAFMQENTQFMNSSTNLLIQPPARTEPTTPGLHDQCSYHCTTEATAFLNTPTWYCFCALPSGGNLHYTLSLNLQWVAHCSLALSFGLVTLWTPLRISGAG